MMNDDTEHPNQDTSNPKREPAYLKLLNAKPSNRKVGQVFITTTKMQPPKSENLSEQKLSPLKEKTLLDIMKEYGVDRQQALNILNQNM
jgi:hypothetical protein